MKYFWPGLALSLLIVGIFTAGGHPLPWYVAFLVGFAGPCVFRYIDTGKVF